MSMESIIHLCNALTPTISLNFAGGVFVKMSYSEDEEDPLPTIITTEVSKYKYKMKLYPVPKALRI